MKDVLSVMREVFSDIGFVGHLGVEDPAEGTEWIKAIGSVDQ